MRKRNAKKWVIIGCRSCRFFLLALICLAAVILTTTTPPAQAADTDATVAALEKLEAKIKNRMTAEQIELGGPIVNSVDMILVPIPAGKFLMGSPETEEGRRGDETQHLVQITKPFYLSAYEVTQQQYLEVMDKNPSYRKGAMKPVENVSWDDATEFCERLSKSEGLKYRLPTEAEWEYACRAGTTTEYSFGDDLTQLLKHAWFLANSDGTTHLVGEKLPNDWGLFDMHGNVWEWCHDWYGKYEPKQMLIDPSGSVLGSGRVLRGGAFSYHAISVRAAVRHADHPKARSRNPGFRLARTYPLSP